MNAIAEQEEDEYFSDDTDAAESLEEIKSISFTYPSRHRLVTPEERSNSEPALPTYYKDWSKQMTSSKPRFYADIRMDSQSIETLRIYNGEENAY